MSKLQWYINRLRAMNVREVMWRVDQKRIEKAEAKRFGDALVNVGTVIWPEYIFLSFNEDALGLNFANASFDNNTEVKLLQGADYDKWPNTFSYKLSYKQRDDLGDARTNWEKNRHFEWALRAKKIFVLRAGNEESRELGNQELEELNAIVNNWMEKNPFLHGISWTSAMEFAIRSINWMFALAFLKRANTNGTNSTNALAVEEKLKNGIINITDYLTKHYSRYSSANNHLLVEATAIGLAGFCFNHEPWIDLACRILSEEIDNQNYSDGVNKELSLHYQTFGMEAYLLFAKVSKDQVVSKAQSIIQAWLPMLKKEAEFVAHSCWREHTVCEFGDDDEGKILDLQGIPSQESTPDPLPLTPTPYHQWEWVLQLASLVTGTRYSTFDEVCENTHWLFTEEEISEIKKKPLYDATKSRFFAIGGNSFLRDKADRVLIGIDHAALGFGSIAAHGHADALSFQMHVDGVPVLVDPGTYIYHCDLEHRNSFRKTINHNTLTIEGEDQSQMLGAFLWGNRAECKLESYSTTEDKDVLVASHNGYKPCIHTRTFDFNKQSLELKISDNLSQSKSWVSTLMLGVGINATVQDNQVNIVFPTGILKISVTGQKRIAIEDAEVSQEYGIKESTKAIRIYGQGQETSLLIKIEPNKYI